MRYDIPCTFWVRYAVPAVLYTIPAKTSKRSQRDERDCKDTRLPSRGSVSTSRRETEELLTGEAAGLQHSELAEQVSARRPELMRRLFQGTWTWLSG